MRVNNRAMLAAIATLMLSLAMGCSHSPDDAGIIAQIQSKLASDSAFAGRTIAVQSKEGVVTLSGTVADEFQRQAAGNHAGSVAGVKTVVNNLVIESAAGSLTPPSAIPDTSAMANTVKAPPPSAKPSPKPAADAVEKAAASAPSPAPAVAVVIPEGTVFSVRMIDAIDSEKNQVGDSFAATLEEPVVVEDKVVVSKGADVQGRVIAAKSGGKFTGRPEISLVLTRLSVGGRWYEMTTDEHSATGSSRGKQTAVAVGGGAALGAVIGGIAGGGKGAAIGAAAGAGAGTGVQAIRKAGQVKVESEAVVDFRLQKPVSVTQATSSKEQRLQLKP